MPQTAGLKRQMLMSHSPGGCKFAIKVPASLAAGERSLPGLQTATFALRPHAVEAEGTLMPLPRALRAPNPPRDSTLTTSSGTNHFPKAELLTPSHWGLGLRHLNLGVGRDTDVRFAMTTR